MIDVQWEKAKHVTNILSSQAVFSLWRGWIGETPHGSTSSPMRDGAEGIRLVSSSGSHWHQGNTVKILHVFLGGSQQNKKLAFTERIVFAQLKQLYMIHISILP